MKEKLVKTLDLKNGLQLNVYDASRNLVGDRWLVSLIARMEIPVTKVLERNDPQPTENVNEIIDVLGECVMFEQKRVKNFVDTAERKIEFKKMYDIFLGSSLNYLSRETFPKKFILKKYKEKKKKPSMFRPCKNTE